MSKLPRLTAREICSVLEKLGFSIARQSGSHMIYKNAEGKRALSQTFRRSDVPTTRSTHASGGRVRLIGVPPNPRDDDDGQTLGGWGHFVRFALYNRAPTRGVADI